MLTQITIKLLRAGAVFCLLLIMTGTNAQTKLNIEAIDRYLETASAAFRFNGVALIARNGTIELNKGYGWKDVKSKTLHDSASIFQIGSITKQFTAAIILKLQEEGKLSVSDPISNYLRSNYYLLGIIIEKITGKPYEQVVHETIFTPLQMTHSSFDFRNLSNSNKTTGYSVFYKEKQIEAANLDSTILYAAGGIYSTTGDMYKWIQAVAHQQILTPHSWKLALTPNKGNYGFGWAIDSLYGRKYITHTGSITNFSSLLLYFPDEDISLILLDNTAGNLWNTGIDISQIIFDQPYPWGEQPEMKLDSTIHCQDPGNS